jgi:CDP-glycerol glycerophosphotransferase (TagB/SpsB family)
MNQIKRIVSYILGNYTIVPKIAFYINEEYIINHYHNVMMELDNDSFEIILDNKFKGEKYKDLIERLTSYSWKVLFLNNVLYVRKYKVLVTHLYLGGNTTDSGTVFSRLLVVYTKIINKLIKVVGLSEFKEPHKQYFQNILGLYNIRFMYGADAGVNSFYEYGNNYNKLFDIFFCHGPRDAEITKSLFDKPIFIMGYPRYDNYFERSGNSVDKNNLQRKYLVDNKKKTILLITTVNNNFSTIETYCEKMDKLTEFYNVIVRPHPLEIDFQNDRFNQNVLDIVTNSKFILCDDRYQDMTALYLISDYIFCDYGGSIFSALYMDKRIILLNHKEVEKDLVVSTSTSMEVREYLPSISQHEDSFLSYLGMDWTRWDQARKKAREYFFGNINTDASKRSAQYLTNMLGE